MKIIQVWNDTEKIGWLNNDIISFFKRTNPLKITSVSQTQSSCLVQADITAIPSEY